MDGPQAGEHSVFSRSYFVLTCSKCLNECRVLRPAQHVGCLQLLEILEIYWTLKTLPEILEISLNLLVLLEFFCVRWFPVIKLGTTRSLI